ncbi:MAG TPA: ATP-binding protein [Dissulfurispiraceae bacterium]
MNILSFFLLAVLGFFNLKNLDAILAKLRFMEISDDLNTTFLEMRLAEKNYFLYSDTHPLQAIKAQVQKIRETIDSVKGDIIHAIGEERFRALSFYLREYESNIEALQTMQRHGSGVPLYVLEGKIRLSGRNLYQFFKGLSSEERKHINTILFRARKITIWAFVAIIYIAMLIGFSVSRQIVRSIHKVEKVAFAISEGKFEKSSPAYPGDEIESVIAAMNRMVGELKSREEELIQSKKLASIGTLTAGVAHELRNPLNNISMIVQNYTELYDSLNREHRLELINKVDGETKRIENIVTGLLEFSKPKAAGLKEADVNAIVEKALALIQNSIDVKNIEVQLSLGKGVPIVYIDEHQILQVLVNLMVNAVQAMSPCGILSLGTRAGEKGETAKIDVRDNGNGIPPEYLPHIFDPFFSTKGVEGTGLGLSVSYGIIKSHHGSVKVDSKVGAGTTFTIELPAHKKRFQP